ncbi:MAG: GNAT family N-acyltransferase [Acidobacteriota bacterium]
MTTDLVAQAATYPVATELIPAQSLLEGRYEVRFARDEAELEEALRLRFEVFNVELKEGLDESWETGLDRDPFDAVCHHLLVIERDSGAVVGTYRCQTPGMAAAHRGLYSDLEFDLAGLPKDVLESAVEVGRACVAAEHRNTQVLFLLWKGLALYMSSNSLRFLFGCCSLTSQDAGEGLAVMRHLEAKGHVHEAIRIEPRPGFECYGPEDVESLSWEGKVHIPKLFRIYLRHGAKVCGPPAIDRDFKTIDYLILFDVGAMDEKRIRTFFG